MAHARARVKARVLSPEIVAIDVHTHVQRSVRADTALDSRRARRWRVDFRTDVRRPTIVDLAELYRAKKMMCVAFSVDDSWLTGRRTR